MYISLRKANETEYDRILIGVGSEPFWISVRKSCVFMFIAPLTNKFYMMRGL